MKKTIENSIDEFTNDSIFLSNYLKVDNLSNQDYDPKLTVKVSKRIEKNATYIIQHNGTDQFIKLLTHKTLAVASSAAEYLYPLYPNKCLDIIKKYAKTRKNPLDRKREEDLINGLQKNVSFFTDHFKTIYDTDDYKNLSRE